MDSTSEADDNQDEYHEDSLPDLVLRTDKPTRLDSTSSQRSLDLLTLVGSPEHEHDKDKKSSHWNDPDYMHNNEEITTEVSESSRDVFKVTYVDHSKPHVTKVKSGANERYRSYLSLMPEHDQDQEHDQDERRSQILSDFRALSYEDQMGQRHRWAEDLLRTEDDIAELKELLAFKTAWCGVLRRNLGLSKWRRLSEMAERTSDSFQNALEAAEAKLLQQAMASESLVKAKESFEALTVEVKERMKKSTDELSKQFKKLVENEAEDEKDANSNSREKLPIVKSQEGKVISQSKTK